MSDREMRAAAKEHLSQVREGEELLKEIMDDINRLERRSAVPGMNYKRVGGRASRIADTTAETAIRIADKQAEYISTLSDFLDLKLETVREIRNVKEVMYCDLLFKRYIQFEPFDVIADEMQRCPSAVRHYHGEALDAFAEANPDVLESVSA